MPVEEYTPTLEDVGTIATTRTRDTVGNLTGTFSSETQPNDESVNKLIEFAIREIGPKIGDDIPEDLREDAKRLVSIRTAMYIELAFFGAEVRANLSPYPQLKQLFDEELLALINSVASEEAGGDPADTLGGSLARFGFPDAEGLWGKTF